MRAVVLAVTLVLISPSLTGCLGKDSDEGPSKEPFYPSLEERHELEWDQSVQSMKILEGMPEKPESDESPDG